MMSWLTPRHLHFSFKGIRTVFVWKWPHSSLFTQTFKESSPHLCCMGTHTYTMCFCIVKAFLQECWIKDSVLQTTQHRASWIEPPINTAVDAWDRDKHFLANVQVQCIAEDRMTKMCSRPDHQSLMGISLVVFLQSIHHPTISSGF